jgi:hypothetical protein
MDSFFGNLEKQLMSPKDRARDWVRRQAEGMQQSAPLTEEQQLQQARDMAPAKPDYSGMANAMRWPSQHQHTFCSWVHGAVVFPDGHTLAFPCACGAVLAHMSDGRSFIDYTHAVKTV